MASVAALEKPAAVYRSLRDLMDGLPKLAAAIGEGASERERRRELPFDSFAMFRRSGLGALRVPAFFGGPAGRPSDVMHVVAALAAADPNVAHALRSHFNFVEGLALSPHTLEAETYLPLALDGTIFGGAFTEKGTAQPSSVAATLKRRGGAYRLNGRKFYATGTAFSDYASFGALDEQGEIVTALLPLDRPGIAVLDDWDGMGQRLTASGGVDLVDVEVLPHEILPRRQNGAVGRHMSSLRQLHLAAVAAGILRNVEADAVDFVRRQARSAKHSHASTAGQDHFVQQAAGEIAAARFLIDAGVAEAARHLDGSAEAIACHAENLDEILIEAALAVAQTQVAGYGLALRAAETIFDTGGGSTTSSANNFDRHWRNIRTLATHNPVRHKARVIGDYRINEVATHLREGMVF